MLAAERAGVAPEAFIASIQAQHERDFADFLVTFDHYHSTHSEENRLLSELIYTRLRAGSPVAAERDAMPPAIERRSEEHTSELQSLMRISYAVFCLKKKNITTQISTKQDH